MIEINLIPDVKRELLRTRMVRNAVISLSIVIGVGAVITTVVLGLVFGGQLAAEGLQDGEIKKKSSELTSIEDLNKTVTIQHQLNKLSEQHANKKINSRLLDMVSAVNPPAPNNVRFSSVKLQPEEKKIVIEGSAANGYAALEVLKKTIANTKVGVKRDGKDETVQLAQDIVAGETSFGEDAEGKKVLRFSFTFSYADELFASSKDAVSIVTPNKRIDVTDSKLGVPESIFGKKADDIDNTKEER